MKKNDLILLHAPSIYDFRNRDDILFAFLSNSASASVSQIYEMYPLGFLALKNSLESKGKKVEIINLANLMLKNPEMDVEVFLKTLDARVFGIDLHWLVHAQGSLSIAKLLKKLHPETPVVFGGISSSLFYDELIEYPQVDFVVRGVDTTLTLDNLLDRLDSGKFNDIPNLCWKDKNGKVCINEFYGTDSYNAHVDWKGFDPGVNYFLGFPGAGCEYNCAFCSGSSYSMRKYHGIKDGFAEKDLDTFLDELQTIKSHNNKNKRVVTLHHWFENIDTLKKVLDTVSDSSVKKIHYTLLKLLPVKHLKLMAQYKMRPLFEISIESHSEEIRKMCGKGYYSNEELEAWLDDLFKYNRMAIAEIYLMIGLPMQTPELAMKEVEYAKHLLEKFSQYDLNVFICPMAPFLDYGSAIYDNPDKFGYRIFFNKLKDYERALLSTHWKNSLNYETQWMSRKQIVDVSYRVYKELLIVKEQTNKLPRALSRPMIKSIDETVSLLNEIEKYEGSELPDEVRKKILSYNSEILKSTSSQQSPFSFSVYKNWYE